MMQSYCKISNAQKITLQNILKIKIPKFGDFLQFFGIIGTFLWHEVEPQFILRSLGDHEGRYFLFAKEWKAQAYRYIQGVL